MISQIHGKIAQRRNSSLLIDVNGLCYEVFLPPNIMRNVEKNVEEDGTIKLITYHYLQVEPAKEVPILIGFLNQIEKEFFERFITVSGVGPKAALKALNLPFSVVAKAIDEANIDLLKSLPGIGGQRAKEIVAKLQGKVGKFALIQDRQAVEAVSKRKNLESEAIQVLLQLRYRKREAEGMVRKALERRSKISSVEELLNEVYREKLTTHEK